MQTAQPKPNEVRKTNHFGIRKNSVRFSKDQAHFRKQLPNVFSEVQAILDDICSKQSDNPVPFERAQSYHKRLVYLIIRQAAEHKLLKELSKFTKKQLRKQGTKPRDFRKGGKAYNAIRRSLVLATPEHPEFGKVNFSRTALELYAAYQKDTPPEYLIGEIYQHRLSKQPLEKGKR